MLTPAQKTILHNAVVADSGANAFYSVGDNTGLANYLNTPISPDYWVWRRSVSRADLYSQQNDLPIDSNNDGFWNWTTYKNQSIPEQNAWVQMFMGDITSFELTNVRAGIAKIFTGSAINNAQAAHCLSIGRKLASFVEKVLATGTGSKASPGIMGYEGPITTAELVGL